MLERIASYLEGTGRTVERGERRLTVRHTPELRDEIIFATDGQGEIALVERYAHDVLIRDADAFSDGEVIALTTAP